MTQDETTESCAWNFNVLGVQHRHTGPGFKVSSERQSVIFRLTSPGIDPQPRVFTSSALPNELWGLVNV